MELPVLMDLRLPEVADGLSLVRNFRASSSEIKIIVLCGHPPDIENAPEAGMVNAILAKPIRTEHLIATVSG